MDESGLYFPCVSPTAGQNAFVAKAWSFDFCTSVLYEVLLQWGLDTSFHGFQLNRQDFRPENSAMRLPLKGIINLLKRLTITAMRQGLIFCLIWCINGVSGPRTVLSSMNMTCLVILQRLGTNAYSCSYSLKEP